MHQNTINKEKDTMSLIKSLMTAAVVEGLSAPVAMADGHATGTLAKIAESGTIVIGHRESSIPFAYSTA